MGKTKGIIIQNVHLDIKRAATDISELESLKSAFRSKIRRINSEAKKEGRWLIAESITRCIVLLGVNFCFQAYLSLAGNNIEPIWRLVLTAAVCTAAAAIAFRAVPFLTKAPCLTESKVLMNNIKVIDALLYGLTSLSRVADDKSKANIKVSESGDYFISSGNDLLAFPRGLAYTKVSLKDVGEDTYCILDFSLADEIINDLKGYKL